MIEYGPRRKCYGPYAPPDGYCGRDDWQENQVEWLLPSRNSRSSDGRFQADESRMVDMRYARSTYAVVNISKSMLVGMTDDDDILWTFDCDI